MACDLPMGRVGSARNEQVVAVATSIPSTSTDLVQLFNRLDYNVNNVRQGHGQVVPVFVAQIPSDLDQQTAERKKEIFLGLMLPILLEVNREIAEDRAYLQSTGYRGRLVEATDPRILELAQMYRATGTMDELLSRVDVIPVSLMMAQAILESGWGTSRFAMEGQAVYGQWTWRDDDPGIVPSERDTGQNHRIRSFSTLLESARAYALNLNTLSAYQPMRDIRAVMSDAEKHTAANEMAVGLSNYSVQRGQYVAKVQNIISINQLYELHTAQLARSARVIVVMEN